MTPTECWIKQGLGYLMISDMPQDGYTHMVRADHIAALEAQVKAADGLVQALLDIIDTGGAFGTASHLVRIDAIARAALATYRAAKEVTNA